MNSTNDKIKGNANKVTGKIKVAVGKLTDDPKLKLKGEAQQLKGNAQKASAEVKDAVKKTFNM